MRFRWISDKRANAILALGFWKFVVYRGLLRFALLGVVFVTLVGLWRDGPNTFATPWWRHGSGGFVIGGVVWAIFLWLLLKLPVHIREAACWLLALAIAAFVASVLIPDLVPANLRLL